MYEITVETHFNAAHFLRDYEGVCARMHGHNFDVIVTVRGGNLHPNGMLIDFKELKTVVEQRIDGLYTEELIERLRRSGLGHELLENLDDEAEVDCSGSS